MLLNSPISQWTSRNSPTPERTSRSRRQPNYVDQVPVNFLLLIHTTHTHSSSRTLSLSSFMCGCLHTIAWAKVCDHRDRIVANTIVNTSVMYIFGWEWPFAVCTKRDKNKNNLSVLSARFLIIYSWPPFQHLKLHIITSSRSRFAIIITTRQQTPSAAPKDPPIAANQYNCTSRRWLPILYQRPSLKASIHRTFVSNKPVTQWSPRITCWAAAVLSKHNYLCHPTIVMTVSARNMRVFILCIYTEMFRPNSPETV